MKIRNNVEYDLNETIVCVHTDSANLAFATSAKTDKEIEEVCEVVLSDFLATNLDEFIKAGEVNLIEGILSGLAKIEDEYESAQVDVYTPSAKSMKAFVAAIYEAITKESVNPIVEFENNIGKLPTEVKNYIKELIDK